MLDPKRPCDCKGSAVDRRRKKRVAKPPTPLNDFEQVRIEPAWIFAFIVSATWVHCERMDDNTPSEARLKKHLSFLGFTCNSFST
jgi:hypothetical protein